MENVVLGHWVVVDLLSGSDRFIHDGTACSFLRATCVELSQMLSSG